MGTPKISYIKGQNFLQFTAQPWLRCWSLDSVSEFLSNIMVPLTSTYFIRAVLDSQFWTGLPKSTLLFSMQNISQYKSISCKNVLLNISFSLIKMSELGCFWLQSNFTEPRKEAVTY